MSVMIAMPGGKFFAVPTDVLEKYSVPKAQFDAEYAARKKTGNTVQPDVVGQEDPGDTSGAGSGPTDPTTDGSMTFGIRD